MLAVTAASPASASDCRLCTELVMLAVRGSTPEAVFSSARVMVVPLELALSPLAALSAVVKSVTKVLNVLLLATTLTMTPPTSTV